MVVTEESGDGRISTWLADLARAPAPPETAQVFLAGDRLGPQRYRIIRELGRGGMGIVYEAHDAKLDRHVAIKTHQIASPDARERLLIEAQSMAKLSHPNVVAVHDVGEFEDGVFLVAELVTGGDLESCRVPQRAWREVLRAYIEAGRGLAYAHAAGIIHRDFKAANVLVAQDGRSQVTDFGLARYADQRTEDDSAGLSESDDGDSRPAGTPVYMSPEQLLGAAPDTRSDQFSFCVASYEALVGRRPYPKTARDLIDGRRPERPRNIATPARVLRVLERGLAVDPSDRHESMTALLSRLERASAPRRRLWLALGGVGIAGAAAASASGGIDSACTRDPSPVDAWSGDKRDALRDMFAREEETARLWPRMERSVDEFVAEWSQSEQAVCERRGVSEDLAPLAELCLEELRLDADSALASMLETSARAAHGVPDRVDAWTRPSTCLREDFARMTAPPPFFLRPHVAELRGAIRKLGNDAASGQEVEALVQRLDVLRPRVEALGIPALRARLAFSETEVFVRVDPERAEQALRIAYREARAAEHNHLSTLAATKLTQYLAQVLGDTKAALEWADIAQTEAKREGVSPSSAVETMLVVAIAYDIAGRWEEAARAYDEALRASDELGSDRDLRRASILISLSGFEGARGNLDRAIETGTEAAKTFERLDGGWSRSSLAAMSNVGLALAAAGNTGEARRIFERELERLTELVGADSHEHVAALLNLGMVAEREGDLESSRRFLTRADVLLERFYGDKHPDRADIAVSLGWLDLDAGHHAEAERSFANAAKLLSSTLGPNAEQTLLAQVGLSRARLAAGKRAEACEPLDEAIAGAERTLGQTRAMARLLRAQGDCAVAGGDLETAIDTYRRSLEIAERVSDTMTLRLDAKQNLAEALAEAGQADEASTLATEVAEHEDTGAKTRARARATLETLHQRDPESSSTVPSGAVGPNGH